MSASISTDPNLRIEDAPIKLPPPPKDKWTLMFFTAGDAALAASMIAQLKEVTDAGFEEHTNVLHYFDPNCNGMSARIYDVNRYRKEKSKNKTVIGDGKNPFVRNIAEDCNVQSLQQMPAALTLRYFLEYARTYYAAENYMLFLMGHGVIVGNDEFLPDTDDNSSITLAELGEILKEFGGKVRASKDEFHLVAFHSCSMSSVELACELQGSARYMMGTQGAAFPGSWPYRQLLKKIFRSMEDFGDDPNLKTAEYPNVLVREILRGLQNLSFYNALDFAQAGFSADLAMCSLDPKPVQKLNEAIKTLVAELKTGLSNGAKGAILLAHLESQSFFSESYTDLFDFCECLQKHAKDHPGIHDACQGVKRELNSEWVGTDPDGHFGKLVVFSDFYGPAYQHSNGLSIFFPWRTPIAKAMTNYENYQFTRELGSNSWFSFLEDYFFLTKRPLKGETKPREEAANVSVVQPHRAALEKMSDEELLRLGPPPRHRKYFVAQRIATLRKDLQTLEQKMGTLATSTAAIPETNKETGSLAKQINSLAKEIASLAKGIGSPGTLAKETATLSKETATLAKEMGSLAARMEGLVKETGTLAEVGKETGTLAKETGSLAKETATLAKETGTLAKETATLGSVSAANGSLDKETATLAKEMASLGLFGTTVIKNFDSPEDFPITSRPKGRPNQDRVDQEELPPLDQPAQSPPPPVQPQPVQPQQFPPPPVQMQQPPRKGQAQVAPQGR